MFGPPGHAYVYFIYGMWFSLNLVCGPEGKASGVLLRAGEILTGAPLAAARRPKARNTNELAKGPARLATALDIDRTLDGIDLCDGDTAPLSVLHGRPAASPSGTQRPAHRRRRRRGRPPLALLDRRRPHRQPLPPARPRAAAPPALLDSGIAEPPNVARAAGDGQRYLRRPPGGTTNYYERFLSTGPLSRCRNSTPPTRL